MQHSLVSADTEREFDRTLLVTGLFY